MEEKISKLLELYYKEWQFRQENLWKRILQLFIAIFFISSLPITFKLFEGASLPNVSMIIYPTLGLFLSFFFLLYCFFESIRIKAIDLKIKQIVKDNYPSSYVKESLPSLFRANKEAGRFFHLRMAVWVPIFLFCIEAFISVFMIWIIQSERLPR